MTRSRISPVMCAHFTRITQCMVTVPDLLSMLYTFYSVIAFVLAFVNRSTLDLARCKDSHESVPFTNKFQWISYLDQEMLCAPPCPPKKKNRRTKIIEGRACVLWGGGGYILMKEPRSHRFGRWHTPQYA